MKIVGQFINVKTGERSDPFTGERGELASMMRDTFKTTEAAENIGVIILMDKINEQMQFSKAPFMQLETFVNQCIIEQVTTNG